MKAKQKPTEYLSSVDPILATVIKRVSLPDLIIGGDYFLRLVKEIIN